MPNFTAAGFSALTYIHFSYPAKENSTTNNFTEAKFAHSLMKKVAPKGHDILIKKNRLEKSNNNNNNNNNPLSRRRVKEQPSPLHQESTRHFNKKSSHLPPRVENGTGIIKKYPTRRSHNLSEISENHQSATTPAEKLKEKGTEADSAKAIITLTGIKNNINILDEFAASSSSLPEQLKKLANCSKNMACLTDLLCKSLEKMGKEQLIIGNESSIYLESQSPHSRQKRSWFGVNEAKLASELAGRMGPYIDQIILALTSQLQGGLNTVANMVENATDHVTTTTNSFAVQVNNIEDMVYNATTFVKETTAGFSNDADEMKSRVANATESVEETSTFVREVLKNSEEGLKHYIYLSGTFIFMSALIGLLTAGCCHCRRSTNTLELTIDKRKVSDDQQHLIKLAHHLITQSVGGHHIDYQIHRKNYRYSIEINDDNIVLQAILENALKHLQKSEEISSATSSLQLTGSNLSIYESFETINITGRSKSFETINMTESSESSESKNEIKPDLLKVNTSDLKETAL